MSGSEIEEVRVVNAQVLIEMKIIDQLLEIKMREQYVNVYNPRINVGIKLLAVPEEVV